ncbi:MAG: transcriptional regulator [Deltaproteobacteria bacterium]|nr:MAG: transcriptional regulator [Deltaproteobacteria bacterium]
MRTDGHCLSLDGIADSFGVSRDIVPGWLKSEGMPSHRVGRVWTFKRHELDAWVRAGGAAAKITEEDVSTGCDEGKEP